MQQLTRSSLALSRLALLLAVCCMHPTTVARAAAPSVVSEAKSGGTIVFYNRVPKTGSTSFWHALATAANESQGHPGQFAWHGVRYHNMVNMRIAPGDAAAAAGSTITQMCDTFTSLAAQGDGVYAIHTPYVDFARFCPGAGLKITYINFLRDPIDRAISGSVYLQACICRHIHEAPRDIRDTLWCKHLITSQLRKAYKRKDPGHFCNWTTNDLVRHHIDSSMRSQTAAINANYYLKYFCGWDPQLCRGSLEERTEAAIKIMDEKYAWVGILELQAMSIRVLRSAVPMLGHIADLQHILHKGDLHKTTASHGHSYDQLKPRVLQRAKKAFAADYKIYNHAIRRLEKQELERSPAAQKDARRRRQ